MQKILNDTKIKEEELMRSLGRKNISQQIKLLQHNFFMLMVRATETKLNLLNKGTLCQQINQGNGLLTD